MNDEVATPAEVVEETSSIPVEENNIPPQELQIKEKEFTVDPVVFLERFKDSQEYREILAKRVAETLQRNPSAPVEKIEKYALESKEVKDEFFEFYREKLKIKYDANYYTDDFNFELRQYFTKTRSVQIKEKSGRLDQSEVEELERDRSNQHDLTANQLVADGVIPNFRLARVFIHFLAVSEGLDVYSPGRDEYRIKYRGF